MLDESFAQLVYRLVAQIPAGRVMTYGQIAALCGNPRSARIVGGIAHYGPSELPWHRVVNKSGGLALGYSYGGREGHKQDLEREGVVVRENYTVDIDKLIWWPSFAKATEGKPSWDAKATEGKPSSNTKAMEGKLSINTIVLEDMSDSLDKERPSA